MKKRLILTIGNQKKHLYWALEKISFHDKWKMLFFPTKKINLDGPDGIVCLWYDLHKEKLCLTKRQPEWGGIMIWAVFSFNGNDTIGVCPWRMNSQNYQGVLEEHVLPFWLHSDRNNHYFQEGYCPIHKSAPTRNWLLDNAIDVLHWLSCSSD